MSTMLVLYNKLFLVNLLWNRMAAVIKGEKSYQKLVLVNMQQTEERIRLSDLCSLFKALILSLEKLLTSVVVPQRSRVREQQSTARF